jgi:hypothetical protein
MLSAAAVNESLNPHWQRGRRAPTPMGSAPLRRVGWLSVFMLGILALLAVRLLLPQEVSIVDNMTSSKQIALRDEAGRRARAGRRRASRPTGEADQNCVFCALTALDQEPDPELRGQILSRMVALVAIDSIPVAVEPLLSLSTPNTQELRDRLVRRWAEAEPARAAAWAAGLADGESRSAVLKQVAIAWANSDLAPAAFWVRSLPDDSAAADASLALAYEAARTDPATALETAGRLLPSPERDAALVFAVSQWAATDFASARDWVSGMPTSDLRQGLFAAIATAASHENGQAAAELAATQLQPGSEQDRAVVTIVQRWAQSSPQAAAAWVEQFPEEALRTTAVEDLAAIWTAQDPQTAAHWIAALPEGSFRDAAIRGSSQVAVGGFPP